MTDQFSTTWFLGNILLCILGLLFFFHWLVLMGVISYKLVWAGKIKTRNDLVKLESLSILIVSGAVIVVALKMKYLNFMPPSFIIDAGIWALFILFTLNTIGNFTAKNPIEKYGFGFLTFVIAVLVLQLATVS